MRSVITISLNGNAYQLDAVGYDALRAYLQVAEQRLAGNPDQEEILSDLEQAIADKCSRYLGPHKNVVSAAEVAEVIREMGPVDGGVGEGAAAGHAGAGFAQSAGAAAGSSAGVGLGSGAGPGAGRTFTPGEYAEAVGENWSAGGEGSGSGGPGGMGGGAGVGAGMGAGAANGPGYAGRPGSAGTTAGPAGGAPRRLYQIREGSFISGVCTGLAAYLNIDVSVVRLLFVLLAVVTGGVWILVYIVMMFVIPYAHTSEEHAAAHGWPFNAEELIARAKTRYAAYKVGEKWRRQQSREQRRMWKYQRKAWKQEQRAWERSGAPYGATPPPPQPPPAWGSVPPANANYSAQVAHGMISPLVELIGGLLFIAFIFGLVSLVTKHRIFGLPLPSDVPPWVGVLVLIVLYNVIASPLRQARRAGYYGTPFGQGWLALWGVLLWLTTLTFFAWLAWQHWAEVENFLWQLADTLHSVIEHRPAATAGPVQAAMYMLPAVAPLPGAMLCFRRATRTASSWRPGRRAAALSGLLSGRGGVGKLQSHG